MLLASSALIAGCDANVGVGVSVGVLLGVNVTPLAAAVCAAPVAVPIIDWAVAVLLAAAVCVWAL